MRLLILLPWFGFGLFTLAEAATYKEKCENLYSLSKLCDLTVQGMAWPGDCHAFVKSCKDPAQSKTKDCIDTNHELKMCKAAKDHTVLPTFYSTHCVNNAADYSERRCKGFWDVIQKQEKSFIYACGWNCRAENHDAGLCGECDKILKQTCAVDNSKQPLCVAHRHYKDSEKAVELYKTDKKAALELLKSVKEWACHPSKAVSDSEITLKLCQSTFSGIFNETSPEFASELITTHCDGQAADSLCTVILTAAAESKISKKVFKHMCPKGAKARTKLCETIAKECGEKQLSCIEQADSSSLGNIDEILQDEVMFDDALAKFCYEAAKEYESTCPALLQAAMTQDAQYAERVYNKVCVQELKFKKSCTEFMIKTLAASAHINVMLDKICPRTLTEIPAKCETIFETCRDKKKCAGVMRREQLLMTKVALKSAHNPQQAEARILTFCSESDEESCLDLVAYVFAKSILVRSVQLRSTELCNSNTEKNMQIYCTYIAQAYEENDLGKTTIETNCVYMSKPEEPTCKRLLNICQSTGTRTTEGVCKQVQNAETLLKKLSTAASKSRNAVVDEVVATCAKGEGLQCNVAREYVLNHKEFLEFYALFYNANHRVIREQRILERLNGISDSGQLKDTLLEICKTTAQRDQKACSALRDSCDKKYPFCARLKKQRVLDTMADTVKQMNTFKKALTLYCDAAHEWYSEICPKIVKAVVQQLNQREIGDRLKFQCFENPKTKPSCADFLVDELWHPKPAGWDSNVPKARVEELKTRFRQLHKDMCNYKEYGQYCEFFYKICHEKNEAGVLDESDGQIAKDNCQDALLTFTYNELVSAVQSPSVPEMEKHVQTLCESSSEWCKRATEVVVGRPEATTRYLKETTKCNKKVETTFQRHCSAIIDGVTLSDSAEAIGKRLSDCNLHLAATNDKTIAMKEDNECLVFKHTCAVGQDKAAEQYSIPKLCSTLADYQKEAESFDALAAPEDVPNFVDRLNSDCTSKSREKCTIAEHYLDDRQALYSSMVPYACDKTRSLLKEACDRIIQMIAKHKLLKSVYEKVCKTPEEQAEQYCRSLGTSCGSGEDSAADEYCKTVQLNEAIADFVIRYSKSKGSKFKPDEFDGLLQKACQTEKVPQGCDILSGMIANNMSVNNLEMVIGHTCLQSQLDTCTIVSEKIFSSERLLPVFKKMCVGYEMSTECDYFFKECDKQNSKDCGVILIRNEVLKLITELGANKTTPETESVVSKACVDKTTAAVCKDVVSYIEGHLDLKTLFSDNKLCKGKEKDARYKVYCRVLGKVLNSDYAQVTFEQSCNYMVFSKDMSDKQSCQSLIELCKNQKKSNQTKVCSSTSTALEIIAAFDKYKKPTKLAEATEAGFTGDQLKKTVAQKKLATYAPETQWAIFRAACEQKLMMACDYMKSVATEQKDLLPIYDIVCKQGSEHSAAACQLLREHCEAKTEAGCLRITRLHDMDSAAVWFHPENFTVEMASAKIVTMCDGQTTDLCSKLQELLVRIEAASMAEVAVSVCSEELKEACGRTFTELASKTDVYAVMKSVCITPKDRTKCEIFFNNCLMTGCERMEEERLFMDVYEQLDKFAPVKPDPHAKFEDLISKIWKNCSGSAIIKCARFVPLVKEVADRHEASSSNGIKKEYGNLFVQLVRHSSLCSETWQGLEVLEYCRLFETYYADKVNYTTSMGYQFETLSDECDFMNPRCNDKKCDCDVFHQMCVYNKDDKTKFAYCPIVNEAFDAYSRFSSPSMELEDAVREALQLCSEVERQAVSSSEDVTLSDTDLKCHIGMAQMATNSDQNAAFGYRWDLFQKSCAVGEPNLCAQQFSYVFTADPTSIEEITKLFDDTCDKPGDSHKLSCIIFEKFCDLSATETEQDVVPGFSFLKNSKEFIVKCPFVHQKMKLLNAEEKLQSATREQALDDWREQLIHSCESSDFGKICDRMLDVSSSTVMSDIIDKLLTGLCLKKETLHEETCDKLMQRLSKFNQLTNAYDKTCLREEEVSPSDECRIFFDFCAGKSEIACIPIIEDQQYLTGLDTLASTDRKDVVQFVNNTCVVDIEARNCKRILQQVEEKEQLSIDVSIDFCPAVPQKRVFLCGVLTKTVLGKYDSAVERIFEGRCASANFDAYNMIQPCEQLSSYCAKSENIGCFKHLLKDCTDGGEYDECTQNAGRFCSSGITKKAPEMCSKFFKVFGKSGFLMSRLESDCGQEDTELCLSFLKLDLLESDDKMATKLFSKHCTEKKGQDRKICQTIAEACASVPDRQACKAILKHRCAGNDLPGCMVVLAQLCKKEANANAHCMASAREAMKTISDTKVILHKFCDGVAQHECRQLLPISIEHAHLTPTFTGACSTASQLATPICQEILSFCEKTQNPQCDNVKEAAKFVLVVSGDSCQKWGEDCSKALKAICMDDLYESECDRVYTNMSTNTYLDIFQQCTGTNSFDIPPSLCLKTQNKMANSGVIGYVFKEICPGFSKLSGECKKLRDVCKSVDTTPCNEIRGSYTPYLLVSIGLLVFGLLLIGVGVLCFIKVSKEQQEELAEKAIKNRPVFDSIMEQL